MKEEQGKKEVKRRPGYVLVDPDQVDCNEPQNVHVLPATVIIYNDKTRGWAIEALETCCGIETKKDVRLHCLPGEMFLKTESRALRAELARMQNAGTRICGNCARHFYADYLDEEE